MKGFSVPVQATGFWPARAAEAGELFDLGWVILLAVVLPVAAMKLFRLMIERSSSGRF